MFLRLGWPCLGLWKPSTFDPEGPDKVFGRYSNKFLNNDNYNEFQQKVNLLDKIAK